MSKEKIICIELDGDQNSGVGDTLELAFSDLKTKSNYHIDLDDVIFYKAKEIKVKQQLIEIKNE